MAFPRTPDELVIELIRRAKRVGEQFVSKMAIPRGTSTRQEVRDDCVIAWREECPRRSSASARRTVRSVCRVREAPATREIGTRAPIRWIATPRSSSRRGEPFGVGPRAWAAIQLRSPCHRAAGEHITMNTAQQHAMSLGAAGERNAAGLNRLGF